MFIRQLGQECAASSTQPRLQRSKIFLCCFLTTAASDCTAPTSRHKLLARHEEFVICLCRPENFVLTHAGLQSAGLCQEKSSCCCPKGPQQLLVSSHLSPWVHCAVYRLDAVRKLSSGCSEISSVLGRCHLLTWNLSVWESRPAVASQIFELRLCLSVEILESVMRLGSTITKPVPERKLRDGPLIRPAVNQDQTSLQDVWGWQQFFGRHAGNVSFASHIFTA